MRQPVQHLRFARRERTEHAGSPVKALEVGPNELEQCALAIAEVSPRAIEYEAHQQALAHVDGQCHRMVDADAAVVIVEKRALAKAGGRQAVADALRDTTAVVPVKAHQRMFFEVTV